MEKIIKKFELGETLEASEMNMIVDKVNELVDNSNKENIDGGNAFSDINK